jgi:uncharacterized protein
MKGVVALARDEKAGRNARDGYAPEHMEIAAYELLRRVAERADDAATVAAAIEIGEQERRMATRLEALFDRAVEAALRGVDPDKLEKQLDSYLEDAHAIEMQAIELLRRAKGATDEAGLESLYGERSVQMLRFGSQARGDAEPESDIDVLVVLQGPVDPGEEIAHTGEVTAHLYLKHDVVITLVFISAEQFSEEQSPLLLNVRREGIYVCHSNGGVRCASGLLDWVIWAGQWP